MKLKTRVISNTIYLFSDWAIVSVISLLFWMVLSKLLIKEYVGTVATFQSLVVLISYFAMFGMDLTVLKMIPEYVAKKQNAHAYAVVKTAGKFLSVTLALISAAFLIFLPQLSAFLKMPPLAIILLILSIITLSFFGLLGTSLYGFMKTKKLVLTDITSATLKLLFSVIFIYAGILFYGPMVGILLSSLIAFSLRAEIKFFKSKIKIPIKKMLYYSIPAIEAIIAYQIIINSNYIILTVIQDTAATGIFAVAMIISTTIAMIPNVLNSALFPVISGLSVDKNSESKSKESFFIAHVFRYSIFVTLPLAISLILFARYAVLIFSKSEFLPATPYFIFLVPAAFLLGTGKIFLNNLYAVGKFNTYKNIWIVSLIIFLPLAIIFTKYFSATGLSVVYLLTMMVLFILSYSELRKYIGIKLFYKDILKVLLASLIISIALFAVKPFIRDVFSLLLVFVPICILYLMLLYVMKFYRNSDVMILEFIAERVPKTRTIILPITNFIKKTTKS